MLSPSLQKNSQLNDGQHRTCRTRTLLQTSNRKAPLQPQARKLPPGRYIYAPNPVLGHRPQCQGRPQTVPSQGGSCGRLTQASTGFTLWQNDRALSIEDVHAAGCGSSTVFDQLYPLLGTNNKCSHTHRGPHRSVVQRAPSRTAGPHCTNGAGHTRVRTQKHYRPTGAHQRAPAPRCDPASNRCSGTRRARTRRNRCRNSRSGTSETGYVHRPSGRSQRRK